MGPIPPPPPPPPPAWNSADFFPLHVRGGKKPPPLSLKMEASTTKLTEEEEEEEGERKYTHHNTKQQGFRFRIQASIIKWINIWMLCLFTYSKFKGFNCHKSRLQVLRNCIPQEMGSIKVRQRGHRPLTIQIKHNTTRGWIKIDLFSLNSSSC